MTMETAPLDNVTHADIRLKRTRGADNGDPLGQVAVFLPELAMVQREYPILFIKDESGAPVPVAILGLKPDENLFVADGLWTAKYTPAWARRGPFMLGKGSGEDPAVLIALDHPRVTRADEDSDPLFLKHGGHAPALEDALDALRLIHLGHEATAQMCALLDELGLIQPLALNVQVSETQSVKFDNFHAVLPDAIDALDAAALARLAAAGFLQPAVLLAHSLGNLNTLIERRIRQGAG